MKPILIILLMMFSLAMKSQNSPTEEKPSQTTEIGTAAKTNFIEGTLRDEPKTNGKEIAKIPPYSKILILEDAEYPYKKYPLKEK